jgi:hypothetical protein
MGADPESAYPAVSNQFNTLARRGQGPFRLQEVQARTTADLLFAEKVYVQGTSLLCSPAISAVIGQDRPLLARHLHSGRISPILSDSAPTFSALAERLIGSRSAAIPTSGMTERAIRKTAEMLDEHLRRDSIAIIPAVGVDALKTNISRKLAENIGGIVKHLDQQTIKFVRESFAKDYESAGVIAGTWWVNLAQASPGGLWADQFMELASLISDLPFATIRKAALVGHSYQRDISEVASLASHIMPTSGLLVADNFLEQLSDDFFDPRDHDPIVGDERVFNLLDGDSFDELMVATADRRHAYWRAMSLSMTNASAQNTREAKERLDEYLSALAKNIRSTGLAGFEAADVTDRRLRTRIMLTDAAGKACIFFTGGAGFRVVADALDQTTSPTLFAIAVTTVSGSAAWALREQKARLEVKRQASQEDLAHMRPATIQLPTTPPSPQG